MLNDPIGEEEPQYEMDHKDVKHQLRKLHIHLKHAPKTQMEEYLRTAKRWKNDMKDGIQKVLQACHCRLGSRPDSHPVVGTTPPRTEKQAHLSIDVMYFAGLPFLHSVDHCTRWSEVEYLRNRSLQEQTRVFRKIQLHWHGVPRVITADGEYGKGEFAALSKELDIKLIITPGNSHESNGRVERANRAIRSYFDLLRSCDTKTPTIDVVHEATYAKNICKGHSLASPFVLTYERAPLLTGTGEPARQDIPDMEDVTAHEARIKLNLMAKSKLRTHDQVGLDEMVYIWRDNEGWVGPSPGKSVSPYQVSVSHNDHIKTASRNRVRKITPTHDTEMNEDASEALAAADHVAEPNPAAPRGDADDS